MMYLVVMNIIFYFVVVFDDGIWFFFLDCICEGENCSDNLFVFVLDLVVSFYFVYVMIVGIVFE